MALSISARFHDCSWDLYYYANLANVILYINVKLMCDFFHYTVESVKGKNTRINSIISVFK